MASKYKYISGVERMRNNLLMQRSKLVAGAVEAVEKTCVDVMNHAKAGHEGNMAHANKRYKNRTRNLTGSIGPPEIVEVTFDRVHGLVPAGMEYAAYIEFGTSVNVRTGGSNRPYPFLTPALLVNREVFNKRMKNLVKK